MIVEFIPAEIWLGTAIFGLFFGGIMVLFYFYSALSAEVSAHSADSEHDLSGSISEAEAGTVPDLHDDLDLSHEIPSGSFNTHDVHGGDLEADGFDTDLDGHEAALSHPLPDLEHEYVSAPVSNDFPGYIEPVDVPDTVIVEGGKILFLSIGVSFLLYGISGTYFWVKNPPTDWSVLFSLIIGVIGGLLMSKSMQKLTQGHMHPVSGITRGNIATVLFEVTPTKSGLVSVKQSDGTSRKAVAIGTFPHDYFSKGDKALVWDARGPIVKITKDFSPSSSSFIDIEQFKPQKKKTSKKIKFKD